MPTTSIMPVITSGHELGCLALNIYHEGRGEPFNGQAAIAAVTMNRVRSKYYPDNRMRSGLATQAV